MDLRTTMKYKIQEFTLRFEGVSGYPSEEHSYVASPTFEFEGAVWELRIAWERDYVAAPITIDNTEEDWLAFYLVKLSGDDCRATFRVDILNALDGSSMFQTTAFGKQFDSNSSIWGVNTRAKVDWSVTFITNDTVVLKLTLIVHGDVVKVRNKSHAATPADQSAPGSLMSDLKNIHSDKSFADVSIITADGEIIPVHKMLLSARSEVFRAMLSSPMSESTTSKIKIDDVPPPVVLALVEYIYTDDFDLTESDNMCDLYGLARRYEMKGLQAHCEARLVHCANAENVLDFLSLGDLYGSETLRVHCLAYICDNRTTLVIQPAFVMKMTAYINFSTEPVGIIFKKDRGDEKGETKIKIKEEKVEGNYRVQELMQALAGVNPDTRGLIKPVTAAVPSNPTGDICLCHGCSSHRKNVPARYASRSDAVQPTTSPSAAAVETVDGPEYIGIHFDY